MQIERHLFVWVDPSAGAMGIDISADRPPSSPPILAHTINSVWLAFPASGGPQASARQLWRVTSPGGWEVLGQVQLSTT
jgi:hypothetical protein